jgi:hypothetical protein
MEISIMKDYDNLTWKYDIKLRLLGKKFMTFIIFGLTNT